MIHETQKGNRILSLGDLARAAADRKSVVFERGGEREVLPAQFVFNYVGSVLHRMMYDGLWVYVPYKSGFLKKGEKVPVVEVKS